MGASGERRDDPPARGADAPGLSALHGALDATVRRHDLDALAIAVADPELGRQVFAAGPGARGALEVLANDPARLWWTSPPTAEPPAEVDALGALARTALRLVVADPDADPASAVEAVVRSLPGGHGVLRTGRVIEVVAAPGRGEDVVRRLAAGALPAGAVVVHDTPAAGPGSPAAATRAQLVGVHSRPETGELEVHLRAGDRRTVGRGPLVRAATAAAAATLDALAALGGDGDTDAHATGAGLRVVWVRTIDTTPEREFLVAVALRRDEGSVLYGLSAGASPIEAAARAALHACNRVLARPSSD